MLKFIQAFQIHSISTYTSIYGICKQTKRRKLLDVQKTRSSSACTASHVVCGTYKVKVVTNAFESRWSTLETIRITIRFCISNSCSPRFKYLKEGRISLEFPTVFPKKYLIVHSTCMRHDHKQAQENKSEIWPNNKPVSLGIGMSAFN